jgi:nitric oxide reductase large subunit
MRAAGKYALTVIVLVVVQALLGGLTTHYTVDGDKLFGVPLAKILPDAVSRTWHIQLAVFWIATASWTMSGGLALMIAMSLLPIGLMQTWASIEHGLRYARSAEFLQQPVMEAMRRLSFIGDTVFLVGVDALA